MTLVEFLTARLDEDEAAVRRGDLMYGDDEWPWSSDQARREVEAKRAIVADLGKCETIRDEHGHVTDYSTGEVDAYRSTAKFLTAVYADHPDYRQEWKPTTSLPAAGMQVPYRST